MWLIFSPPFSSTLPEPWAAGAGLLAAFIIWASVEGRKERGPSNSPPIFSLFETESTWWCHPYYLNFFAPQPQSRQFFNKAIYSTLWLVAVHRPPDNECLATVCFLTAPWTRARGKTCLVVERHFSSSWRSPHHSPLYPFLKGTCLRSFVITALCAFESSRFLSGGYLEKYPLLSEAIKRMCSFSPLD